MSNNAEKLIEEEPKLSSEPTTYCSFDKNFQNDWQNVVKNTQEKSDPTCGGVLAQMNFEPESQSASEPSSTDVNPGPRVPGFDNMIDRAINVARMMAPDKVLEQKVDQLIKDFGSKDFKVRDAAEKAAKQLPVEAIPLLKKGLQSESPEVQDRTERSIFGIKMAHLEKCLKPVKEIRGGINELYDFFKKELDPDIRKKFEDKIKKADDLPFSQEDLDLAAEICESHGDSDFDKLITSSHIKGALELRASLRMRYAEKLAETKDPEDRKRAIELLKEAIKVKGWEKYPGLVKDAVEKLGGVDGLPKEIKEAYKASLEKIKSYDRPRNDQPELGHPWRGTSGLSPDGLGPIPIPGIPTPLR